MAQLNNVKPGDLIKAADWNAMVAAVQGLTGVVNTGPVTVPNVFGFTLANAVALITLPATQLVVGAVIDSLGNTINTALASSNPLIVLNQMPAAGTGVQAQTPVNLVVTPVAGSGPPPPPQLPAISGFKTTQPVPITATVEIDGQNFDPTPGNNKVTFATVPGTVGGNSNKNQLFVTVPTGIAGAPTTAGATLPVAVVVTTSAGQSAPGNLSITAPPATPVPTIGSFSPAGIGTMLTNLTISGTGFDATTLANNSVIFSNITQPATSATATTIVVQIPTGINGVNPGGQATIGIIVQVSGVQSLAKSYIIASNVA